MAAILAADVAGFSRLTEADEEGTHVRLKAHRRELIDPKIQEHHGRIVKTSGDGVLVEFPSVVEAVRCAIEVQHGMAERDANTPKHRRIEFRVGINLGDIIVDKEDIHGDGVNIAARLENLARPGSIYISGTAFDHVQHKITVPCKFLGKQRVRNITEPVRVYRVRLERHRTVVARQSRRTKLIAGAALLMVIGVTGAFYMQHRASVMATGSIPNAPQTAVQAATAPPETPKDLPPLDAQVWEAIRNSTNPADYEAYLRLFPTGAVADLARQRLWVLTPASPPPVSTTEPIPAAPKPKPQQKEAAATPTPAPQQQASAAAPTSAATSKKEATTKTFPSPIPDREVPATTGASASTTPTPVPQRQAGAAAPTSAAAPIATPQQQALNAPDVSKSVTSSPSPNAPYDGEWKGFILAYSCPGGGMASCGGDMTVRVANNAVSGTFEGAFGKRSLSGNIAGDGSFIGNLENAPASGKFDKDRFRGVVSSSPQPGSISGAVLLERVK
jgi:class 3 adenylate cyclase